MGKLFAPERRNKILEKLNENKRITVKELSREIHVSEVTLRADLAKMEEEGLLLRTHGGAILADPIPEIETKFDIREKKNKSEKSAIAKKAVEFIQPGQCILLDASSTALQLARQLKDSPIRLTVVTSGINTALELKENQHMTVILLGGIAKRESFALEGSLGVDLLKKINIDMMFTSASGFTLDLGLTDFSVYEVELKKEMVNSAEKVVALLDYTKINKNSIASFASLEQIDTIITDADLDESFSNTLKEKKIRVIKASADL